MEYRKIIEKGTIGLAVEKITEDDFALLEKTCVVMSNPECDLDEYTQADLDFHHHLARISQNSMIIKVYDLISEILTTAMRDLIHLAGRANGPVFHRNIIDALRKHDKAECEALMEAHIESNIEAIRGLAEKTG